MMKRAVLVIVLVWAACSGPQIDQAAHGPVINVATITWVGYAPLYLAKEMGFYKGIDVRLERIEDTAARRSAMASGQVHGSVDIMDSFANSAAAGLPASVVLKLDDSMGGDGIIVRKEIQSVQDLRGKSVAYPQGMPSHFFLLSLLDNAGLTIDDVESWPMEADQAGAAFVAGSVDAAVTWEPWLTRASEMEDAHILTSSRDTPGLIVDVLTVRNDFLEEKPQVVEALIRGWFRAVEYWKASPDEAGPIMAESMGLEPDDFKQMVSGVRYADLEINQAFFEKDESGQSPFSRLLQRASETWRQQGVIRKPVSADQVDGSSLVLAMQP